MKNTALRAAGVIFFIVSVAHLLRAIYKVEVMIGGWMVPLWVSLTGFLVALALSVWMFRSLK